MSTDLQVCVPSAEDQERAEILFTYGASGLLASGMPMADVLAFSSRADVLAIIQALMSECEVRDDLLVRQQFMAKRSVARLLPAAMSILRRALAGPVYARDARGTVLRTTDGDMAVDVPAPTGTMLMAARDVLDRMGIDPDKKTLPDGVNMEAIMVRQVRAPVAPVLYEMADASAEQKALSREKRRNVVERLLPTISLYMKQQHQKKNSAIKRRARKRAANRDQKQHAD